MTRSAERPSVIITCFNLELYVGEAIRSVLSQDYDAPFEVIVVDDGSTDRSAEIIRQFPEVRYLRTERNSGVLLATVAGLEAASGDLVFFLDGDDLWEPGKLAAVCEGFASDPGLALVTHDLSFIDQDGTMLDRESRPSEHLSKMPATDHGTAVRQGILELRDHVWLGSAYAVRRGAADLDGFCAWAKALPEPRDTYQDWPLAYWIAAKPGTDLGYVASKLFRYRLHGLNHSGDASTPEKVVRNFRRTLNTVLAMQDIAVRTSQPPKVRRVLRERIAFYRYLISLYSGRKMAAAAGFGRSLAYLARNPGSVPKELARFLGVQILGARRFTQMRFSRPGAIGPA